MNLWEAVSAEQRGVYVRPIFVRAAGDLVTGALLSQLAYWFRPDKNGKTKVSIKFEGKTWLAKSREDLCEECGITLAQYRRAVKVLEKRGLIETRTKLFAGKVTRHFRINEEEIFHAGALKPSSLDPLGDCHLIQSGEDDSVSSCDKSSTITETMAEKTIESTVKHSAGQTGAQEKAAIEKLLKEQLAAEDLANTVTGNVQRWEICVRTIYGFQKPLTAAERGIVKSIMEIAGDGTPELIRKVTQHWMEYAMHVKYQMAYSHVQKIPTVAFLFKYLDLALQLIASEEASEPKQKVTYVYE